MSITQRLENLEAASGITGNGCPRCPADSHAVRYVYPGDDRRTDPQPRPRLCPSCGRDTLTVITVNYVERAIGATL